MKIVILDAATLNPGDLSWDIFKDFGAVSVYQRSTPAEVLSRAKDAEVIIINKIIVDKDVINKLSKLKFIAMTATGYNTVDTIYAKSRGILVSNVPVYSTDSVVQMVFAHILNFACRFVPHVNSVKKGDWQKAKSFCYSIENLSELQGKVLGIIGFGNIGQKVAEIGKAFGMQIVFYHYKVIDSRYQQVSIDDLCEKSDYVSLHIPLNSETQEFMNDELISKMKPTAFLINTARGGLIQEDDLAEALNKELIAGAGLEVLSLEPPVDNPLLRAKNCYITPHNCWTTKEARQRLIQIAYDNVAAWVSGEPVNVVPVNRTC